MTVQRAVPLTSPLIHVDRLFPADIGTRTVARRLYAEVKDLPIVSPHGHTDPRWYAENAPFPDPAKLFVVPDHYIFRMLYSQGVALEDLGIARRGGLPRHHRRARRGDGADHVEQVFPDQRHPIERRERLALGVAAVRGQRLGPGAVGGDGQEDVVVPGFRDAGQQMPGQVRGPDLASPEEGGQFPCRGMGQSCQIVHHPP